MRRRVALSVIAALLVVNTAHAQFIDARVTGVPGVTLDFNTLAIVDFTPVTSVSGVTFGNAYFGGSHFFGSPFGTGALYNVPPAPSTLFGLISIRFGGPTTAAAFNLATDAGTTTFTAFLNGAVVSTFNRPTNVAQSTLFFGFEDVQFDRIDVQTLLNGTTDPQIAFTGIDNLQVTTRVTPEPGTLALTVAGLVMVCGAMRRRARSR